MRFARIGLLAGAIALVGALWPAAALAESVATTGNPTSITASSVVLNGVVDPTYEDSVWFFEYSTSSNFGADKDYTKPIAVSNGLHLVSATVDGLAPATVYYERVVVEAQPDTTLSPVFNVGDAESFVTLTGSSKEKKDGVGSLTSRTILVKGGVALVIMHCKGTAGALCTATESLTAEGASGKPIACGSGRFIASAPHTHTVRTRLASGCLSLLLDDRGHRIGAHLTALFSTRQPKLSEAITLVE
jgi:hypothetical protein